MAWPLGEEENRGLPDDFLLETVLFGDFAPGVTDGGTKFPDYNATVYKLNGGGLSHRHQQKRAAFLYE